MKYSFFVSVALLFSLVSPAVAQSCETVQAVEWMLGTWEATGPRNKTMESWKKVSESTFEGFGRVTRIDSGELRSFESMQMAEMTGSVFFIAKPRQNKFPTGFELVQCSMDEAVFENMEHDFPKRLRYVRVGSDSLHVDVTDGGENGFSIHFGRAASN